MRANFYHLFADGQWEQPLAEHIHVLRVSGFSGALYAGLVGSPGNRRKASQALAGWEIITEADTGYEQVTLEALHAWARKVPASSAVLYAHTKGAAYGTGDSRAARWRHAMNHETVAKADEACAALLGGSDLAGAGWEEPPNGFFFGNFWWATAGYVTSQPVVSRKNRYEAETWLGKGNPRVTDLCPGFTEKYQLGWDYAVGVFGMGFDCPDNCMLHPARPAGPPQGRVTAFKVPGAKPGGPAGLRALHGPRVKHAE